MRTFLTVLAILLAASSGVAAACPAPTTAASIPQFPPVMIGGGTQMYYCAASAAALTVGDLSPSEWAKRVQVCSTNCSYEPMSPTDPHSLLIATSCSAGFHDPAYLVQPPAVAVSTRTNLIKSCNGNSLAPGKGPAPAPSSGPGTALRR